MWLKGLWQIPPLEALARCRWNSHYIGIRNVPAFVTVRQGFLSLQPLSAHVSVYSPRSLIILIEIV